MGGEFMIGPSEYILVGLILFIIGISGVILRRNIIFILISLEVAVNGIFLVFFGAEKDSQLILSLEVGAGTIVADVSQ
jgi:NADH:ubiquinone oxidoreductase subunit K